MKVIVKTETQLGSGTSVYAYMPPKGMSISEALKNLYQDDLDFFADLVDDSGMDIDNQSAFIFAGDYSYYYDVVEVKTI